MAGSHRGCRAIFSARRSENCGNSIMQKNCAIWPLRPEIGWRRCAAAVRVSIAFGSTISGASASFGEMEVLSASKSSTTTGGENMRDLPPIHPGEQLREEFMKPLGLTAYRLAKDIGVPVTRVQAIIAERRGITGDTALRLARYFGTSPEFWLNMQRDFELETAAEALGSRLDTEVKPRAA